MSLKEEDRRILVELEMEKAYKTLGQVEVLQREKYWDTMANVTEADIVSKVAPTMAFIDKVKQYIAKKEEK